MTHRWEKDKDRKCKLKRDTQDLQHKTGRNKTKTYITHYLLFSDDVIDAS